MKLFKNISREILLYNGLIITFAILYIATAFVSWYHAIVFFNIANAVWLSVILSFVAEVGQASALFSILLTKKQKFLTWGVMVILTTLQVIGNVVSSYDWIIRHNSAGVESFQKSILFWMQTTDSEIFKVVIAWISGALLPIIALAMTALVAQNMNLRDEEKKEEEKKEPLIDPKDFISEVVKIHPTKEDLDELSKILNAKKPIEKVPPEEVEINSNDILGRTEEEIKKNEFYESEEATRIRDLMKKIDEISPTKVESHDYMSPEVQKERLDSLIKEQVSTEIPIEEKKTSVVTESPSVEIIEDTNQEGSDDLDEDVAMLIPEIQEKEVIGLTGDIKEVLGVTGTMGHPDPSGIRIDEPVEDPEVVITHRNGLIEAVTEAQPQDISEEEEKKRIEEERLERLRAIARENLKKK